MPLEITWPLPNTTFGPGSFLEVHQSDIGPIPFDDRIEVQIRDEAEQILFGWWVRQAGSVNTWSGLWVLRQQNLINQGWSTLLEKRRNATDGEQVRLFAQQLHADGTSVGTISIPITWSPTVTSWVADVFPFPAATLNPDQSDKLDQILAAVYRTWPDA